ncbi:MAG: hypothetical protein ACRDV9_15010 [Acidimicrobiia bacterium]
MIGPAQAVVQEDLQPSLQLDDLNQSPYKFLSRDFLLVGNFFVTAAAAQFATVTLALTPSPTPAQAFLLWVQRIHLASDIAQAISFNRNGAVPGVQTGQGVFSRDSRADSPAGLSNFLPGLVSLSTSSEVALIANANRWGSASFGAGTDKDIAVDLVLGQGQSFNIQAQVAVATLRGFIEAQVLNVEPTER